MFANCFPNTLDTTVFYESEPEDDTFVVTGDIPAMWLRDSSAQVWPYLMYANEDERLRKMIRGVILRQFRLVLLDPMRMRSTVISLEKGSGKMTGHQ